MYFSASDSPAVVSGRRPRPAYIVVRSIANLTGMILFGTNDWNSSGTTSWNYEWTSPSRVGPQGVETPACPSRECPQATVSPEHRARQRTTKPPARPQRNQGSSQADLRPNQHTPQPRPYSSSSCELYPRCVLGISGSPRRRSHAPATS